MGQTLSLTRQLCEYEAIKELAEAKGYSIKDMCRILGASRSAYYHWLRHPRSADEAENDDLAAIAERIHREHPDMGYRRLGDALSRECGRRINDKRILRICRAKKIQSAIKWKPKCCTRGAKEAAHVADNVLNREFTASAPNEKWLTDVSEFKYDKDGEVRKVYLSAVLDIYDRRIVAYRISDSNDNPLVMETFREAFEAEPDAHPLCHSDRGFQYTGAQFWTIMQEHGCVHSMSRVAHCIDNGPMEGFWGILKRETYYGRKFTCRTELIESISSYIDYYNNRRIQRKLHRMTPMEFHNVFDTAA